MAGRDSRQGQASDGAAAFGSVGDTLAGRAGGRRAGCGVMAAHVEEPREWPFSCLERATQSHNKNNNHTLFISVSSANLKNLARVRYRKPVACPVSRPAG